MWGFYPEARDWNVGALCLYFSLDEQKFLMLRGLFIKIRSPNLKFEHRAPTFQSFASGQTPHMPMFRRCEIFTFQLLGPVLRSISWPLKLLGASLHSTFCITALSSVLHNTPYSAVLYCTLYLYCTEKHKQVTTQHIGLHSIVYCIAL